MNSSTYELVVERIFEETLGLLEEARDFVAYHIAVETDDTPPATRLAVRAEQFRLTSRLSSVLAWLLHRKAVTAGKATDADLTADATCLDGAAYWCLERRHTEGPLPGELMTLLERSRLLYDRAMRLDTMIRKDAGAAHRKAAKDPRSVVNRRRRPVDWNSQADHQADNMADRQTDHRADNMAEPERRSDTDRRR